MQSFNLTLCVGGNVFCILLFLGAMTSSLFRREIEFLIKKKLSGALIRFQCLYVNVDQALRSSWRVISLFFESNGIVVACRIISSVTVDHFVFIERSPDVQSSFLVVIVLLTLFIITFVRSRSF